MGIKEFQKKYSANHTIDFISRKWKEEKLADDFLGSKIMGGVLVSDFLLSSGDALSHVDFLSDDVKDAFLELMKGKVDSYSELRNLVIEKLDKGEKSLNGLINKIQGQYGENEFVKSIGGAAELAPPNQEGWDVKILRDGGDEHIQVKVYQDSSGVLEHIKKVNEKVLEGKLGDVEQINFAVNSDIYDEVQQKVSELGLSNKIYDIGITRDTVRENLESAMENIGEVSFLDNFFSDLLGTSCTAAAIHAAANAFLVWKCSKEKSKALEDTIYSTALSSSGIAASLATRTVLAETAALTNIEIVGSLMGPIGLIGGIGIGLGMREYLKRIASRRDVYSKLQCDLEYNQGLNCKLKNA